MHQNVSSGIGYCVCVFTGRSSFSVLTGNVIIPYLSIASSVGDLKVLPEVVFKLDIPQIMGVMSALVFPYWLVWRQRGQGQ